MSRDHIAAPIVLCDHVDRGTRLKPIVSRHEWNLRMEAKSSARQRQRADREAFRHMEAWLLLVVALALHVVDEAVTNFLDFYNPLVLSIRSRISWFPMPTLTFGIWLTGLAALVMALALSGRSVRNGVRGTQLASWMLAGIMFVNGIGHVGGSMYFQRWLPGTTSAPLLLVASIFLASSTWKRAHLDSSRH